MKCHARLGEIAVLKCDLDDTSGGPIHDLCDLFSTSDACQPEGVETTSFLPLGQTILALRELKPY